MSAGKYCTKGDDRCATIITIDGILWHEEAREFAVDRVRNQYELDCWIKPVNVLATVQKGRSQENSQVFIRSEQKPRS